MALWFDSLVQSDGTDQLAVSLYAFASVPSWPLPRLSASLVTLPVGFLVILVSVFFATAYLLPCAMPMRVSCLVMALAVSSGPDTPVMLMTMLSPPPTGPIFFATASDMSLM